MININCDGKPVAVCTIDILIELQYAPIVARLYSINSTLTVQCIIEEEVKDKYQVDITRLFSSKTFIIYTVNTI